MRVKWVQQQDDYGCGIACCAMISGKSYDETKAETVNLYQGGMDFQDLFAYLFEQGYFLRRFDKINLVTDETRKDWPVLPADRCIACVLANRESSLSHFVVVEKGVVFDPADITIKSLDAYVRVFWVVGITKPRRTRSHGTKQGRSTRTQERIGTGSGSGEIARVSDLPEGRSENSQPGA